MVDNYVDRTKMCNLYNIENNNSLFIKAITEDNLEIIKKLEKDCYYFSLNSKIETIIFNRFEIFKRIHITCLDKNQDILLMNKAVAYNRLNFIDYLFKKNVDVPDNILVQSILCKNKELKDWVIKNTTEYPCKSIEVIKILNIDTKELFNDLVNYELKSFILIKVPLISELEALITYYINKNNITLDYNILSDVWRLIEKKLIIHLFSKNNISLIKNILSNIIIRRDTFFHLFDELLYTGKDYKYFIIWKLMIDNKLKLYLRDFLHYFIDNIPIDLYDSINNNSNICYNILKCNTCINKENLIYDNWDSVFNRGDNTIIYKSVNNYCFELKNLLNCWEEELNSFNYVVCPKYPSNPYTKELIDPIEFYKIIIYCCKFKIEIPFIISFVFKNPTLLYLVYNYFIEKKNDNYIASNYLKNFFKFLKLKYNGGNSSDNIAGKWEIDEQKFGPNEILFFKEKIINIYIAKLLFIKIITIQESKLLTDDDFMHDNNNYNINTFS